MRAMHFGLSITILALLMTGLSFADSDPVLAPKPSKKLADKITEILEVGDSSSTDAAVRQIRFWVDAGETRHIIWNFNTAWLQDLMNAKRFQDVIDLSLAAIVADPSQNIESMMKFRARALVAIDKPQEALQAAKAYFNVCSIRNTEDAVNLVALCVAQCHPQDDQIVHRFRKEQFDASNLPSLPSVQDSPSVTKPSDQVSAETPLLKSVHIDTQSLTAGLQTWSVHHSNFHDRVGYGNLLLVADRSEDAEKLFRELYQSAATEPELITAIEGIARSLRAEDGTVARANVWLLSLKQAARAADSE